MENKLSIGQVCELLGKSRKTLWKWRQHLGEPGYPVLRFQNLGRQVLYYKPDVEAYRNEPTAPSYE